MITVNWKHLILDEDVFQNYKTHRVARVRARAAAAGVAEPFPTIPDHPPAVWHGESDWTATTPEQGFAPEQYPYGGRTYVFARWAVRDHTTSGRTSRTGSFDSRFPSVRYTGEPVIIEATAYYVWNLGSGPGGEGLYLDAFDESIGDYIPDDFVVVDPDEPVPAERLDCHDYSGRRACDANNGFLSTDDIKEGQEITVTATDPLARMFVRWKTSGNLNGGPFTVSVPDPPGRTIRVRRGGTLRADANYISASVKQASDHPPFWVLIGNLADGPFIIIRPGQVPPIVPGGPQPGDPPIFWGGI